MEAGSFGDLTGAVDVTGEAILTVLARPESLGNKGGGRQKSDWLMSAGEQCICQQYLANLI